MGEAVRATGLYADDDDTDLQQQLDPAEGLVRDPEGHEAEELHLEAAVTP